ncbi:Peptidoglycan/LPS O-acetylase OafA/YrhL, contains acyltransferase and SGNH-hydrolase domains [Flexibacter flexilis DSM 6793]|uniref:Peptidoglycan/LPS O-acetylase OafA/YrhL, contains acyltransferase and SGNH-hydrolase domains n=1 Tax=Flexibacter flexilis DSM 6793 TaxID=927664 RepID=A0A1I1NL11_9BACT|nr:acyltransferase [Flexibacter flexilis]SFC98384.1 Peptidoglycan/LPS O-acetylase OafA/YrhL, contains acyltransferase and SGNH-hydrolase domains [Flexibacter flexilis DSM 6793]
MTNVSIRAKNNFDILRFFAASFVIITHWSVLIGKPESDTLSELSNGAISFSGIGIKSFFIISGYLITKSLESSSSYLDYFVKRFLRIIPALAAASLFCILVGYFFASVPASVYFSNVNTWTFMLNVFLLKMQWELPYVFENQPYHAVMGSAWSLVYEMMMYFILAFAYALGFLSKKRRVWYIVAFFILIVFYEIISFYPVPDKFRYYLIYTDLDLYHTIYFMIIFQLGSIYYLYRDNIKYINTLAFLMLVLWIITWYIPFFLQFKSIITALFLPYLLFWLAFNPALNYTYNFGKYGDFSYGIYLYGMFVQQVLIAILGADYPLFIMMPLSVLISAILGYFSWHWVEKPALELRKYILPSVKR